MKIPWAKPAFSGKEKKYVLDALSSTWISDGPYVEKFEEEFLSFLGARYGMTASNGTAALELALLALDIGPSDEVVVPGFGFVSAANMVIDRRATPVYADIDPLTWCIDPRAAKKLIAKRTKAIIAVHTYGNVCNMRALKEIAARHKIYLIEDAAEAAFSKYKNRYAGTWADIGCFSFQATKTITTGEGGFILTADKDLYSKMRLFRNHGMLPDNKYWHESIGYNFRLSNIQAAMGCAQLENKENIISERKKIYSLYKKYLSDEKGIAFQHFPREVDAVVWTVAIKVDPKIFKGGRNFVMKSLAKAGIETRPGFYPMSVMPLYKAPKLPVSEEVGLNVMALPTFCGLTEKDISFICNRIKKLKKSR
jgi:perosamine synthetase